MYNVVYKFCIIIFSIQTVFGGIAISDSISWPELSLHLTKECRLEIDSKEESFECDLYLYSVNLNQRLKYDFNLFQKKSFLNFNPIGENVFAYPDEVIEYYMWKNELSDFLEKITVNHFIQRNYLYRILFHKKIKDKSSLDFSKLTPGYYLLYIEKNNHFMVKKIYISPYFIGVIWHCQKIITYIINGSTGKGIPDIPVKFTLFNTSYIGDDSKMRIYNKSRISNDLGLTYIKYKQNSYVNEVIGCVTINGSEIFFTKYDDYIPLKRRYPLKSVFTLNPKNKNDNEITYTLKNNTDTKLNFIIVKPWAKTSSVLELNGHSEGTIDFNIFPQKGVNDVYIYCFYNGCMYSREISYDSYVSEKDSRDIIQPLNFFIIYDHTEPRIYIPKN